MEVIKPVDFSSFTAFCEHLNTTTTAKAKAIAATAAATVETSTTPATSVTAIVSPTTTTVVTNSTTQQHTQINGNIYVEKMERQGKMEMAAKERESQRLQCIPKKWNRREEYEFLRVLTGYGVDLQPLTAMMSGNTLSPDWTKFKQIAHLERKSDETLSDYYKVFIAMCKRQAGVKLNENERGLESIIEDISEDHAKLILDRLELLSKLREIARHPQLEKRLKLCMKNADTPDWWEPGRHDKELIAAVLKHGLYRSETFIFNDQTFSFAESEKRFIRELEAQIQRSIKLEAYNAEKMPIPAATSAAQTDSAVKTEVIDLDDELLTKSSLIKKENYTTSTPLKEEAKVETSKKVVEEVPKDATESREEAIKEATKVDVTNEENAKQSSEKLASNGEKEAETSSNIMDTNEANKEEQPTTKKQDTVEETEKSEDQSNEKKVEADKLDTDEDVASSKIVEDDSLAKINTELAEKSSEESKNKEISEEKSNETKAPETAADEVKTDDVEKTLPDDPNEHSHAEKEISKDIAEECVKKVTDVEETPPDAKVEQDTNKAEETTAAKKSKCDEDETTQLKEKVETEMKSAEAALTEESAAKASKDTDVAGESVLDLAATATTALLTTSTADPDDDEVMKEKEKAVEEECKKQAAELKARFPDLEVIQPATVKQKLEKPKLEMCMIRWFKDFALERRIAHIVTCVETNKWPVDCTYSAYTGCKGIDLNIGLHEAIPHLNAIERRSTTPDVITITTDQGVTKHLPASQMQQVAGVAAANAAAAITGSGKAGSGVTALDANSINAAVAAAVAAATGAPTSGLPPLLPGMSMTATNAASAGIPSGGNTTVNANSGSGSSATTPTGGGKKRKRHIAIDVETERAKLHALLNSSPGMGPKDWETEIANMEALTASAAGPTGRRSANSAVSPASVAAAAAAAASSMGNLQPPPAHQHASLSRQNSGQFNKPAIPPMKTPPPSMGAPMDLSSSFSCSLPKISMTDMLKSASSSGAIDLSEVQDFSMSSKKLSAPASSIHAALNSAFPSLGGSSGGGGKSKLDDTLNKLMKKNNCTIEEPVVGKEKKRKKLDEIVLGLSAAKEQKTFPDPSLPSSKKPQIPPSVSVTPANVPSSLSNQNQSNQKPFTITVTTVPGKSKSSSGNSGMPSSASGTSNSGGLSALQNMTMGGLSSKDSLNALLAQTMATDPQTFLKQQQKMMQCLPPAQRKIYENMLAEMEQAMKMSAKYSPHDVKVNKWLSDMSAPLNDQLSMEYASASSSSNASGRRSGRQSNASQQQASTAQMSKSTAQSQQMHQSAAAASAGPQGLTGEEPVPVINKQTGKRLTGNKAPQLKRLMQWLTENPQYEVDPKWLEQMQNPMPAPSPKPSAMDTSYGVSNKSHGGRPSSTSSNASSSGGSHSQLQAQSSSSQSSSSAVSSSSKKSSRQSAIDQANAAMQFGSLAGLNPNLLASLPGLGAFDPKNPLAAFDPKNSLAAFDPKNPLSAFDPKNPLLSMPFAGMPGMGNIPGLGNLNNMNLFASLAGMGGLGNLAGMDAQSLAALMAAAGPALTGLGGTTGSSGSGTSGAGKSSSQASSSSNKKNKNNDAAAQLAAANAAVLANAAGSSNSGGSGSSSSKNAAAASAAQLAAGLPFLFPNPSLLYPPMGLSGLNPYSLGSTGLGPAYDQLAQQYNLLNGGTNTSSAGSSSTTQSKSHQSQSKSSSSRSSNASSSAAAAAASAANLMNAMASMTGGHGVGGSSSSNQSSSQSSSRGGGGRQSAASRAAAQASAEMAQLSNLLMPGADPHLLESLSRMAGMDLAQATRLMSSLGMPPVSSAATGSSDKRSSSNSSAAAAAAAQAAQEKQAAKEQQKWMESLARGVLPTDLATLQAFSQGKLPASLTGGSGGVGGKPCSSTGGSSSSSSKNAAKAAAAAAAAAAAQLPQIPGMPGDFSQAFLAEMAAQAMAGTLPLTGPGSLASLAGLTAPPSSSSSSSSASAKRQREQDAMAKDVFKQQMDYYTKTLGLGSGISLIPTSMAGSSSSTTSSMSGLDDHHKSKRSRMDAHSAAAVAAASLKADEMTAAAMAAAGLPLNLGGGMTSIEKSLRGSVAAMAASLPPPSTASSSAEADKVTLTPLNSAGIAANLPSQTTITIAPPISSGASSSSERSERSESRMSLTITNAADAAKLPPPYEEADELIIQPILKKPAAPSSGGSGTGSTTSPMGVATNTASAANPSSGGGNNSSSSHEESSGSNPISSGATTMTSSNALTTCATTGGDTENRRSSTRLKRPRSGADHSLISEQPPEKRRELRSTRHTRQSSGGNADASLNLSTSEGDEKAE